MMYRSYMRKIIFCLLMVFPHLAFGNDLIISKEEINSWGYIIEESGKNYVSIKRIKGEKWSETQKYYPRFYLYKNCFSSHEKAKNEQEAIITKNKNDPFGGDKSHYNSFIVRSCLYSITTGSRHTYLSYQPGVLEKFKNYATKQEEP